jgi:hypothetical protein
VQRGISTQRAQSSRRAEGDWRKNGDEDRVRGWSARKAWDTVAWDSITVKNYYLLGIIRMGVEEVQGIEGVRRGVIRLIYLGEIPEKVRRPTFKKRGCGTLRRKTKSKSSRRAKAVSPSFSFFLPSVLYLDNI